jgi:hypothetical protein
MNTIGRSRTSQFKAHQPIAFRSAFSPQMEGNRTPNVLCAGICAIRSTLRENITACSEPSIVENY